MRGMRRSWFAGVLVVSSALLALPFGQGCAEEPSTSDERADREGDLVRGLLGTRSVATEEDRSAARAFDAVGDAIVGELDVASPGRVARLERELRSHDAERMVAAKNELDAAVAKIAADGTLAQRLGGGSLVTQAVHPLDQAPTQLVGDASQLLCEQPKGADGRPLQLGRSSGTFGDDRTGVLGAARDTGDLVDTQDWNLLRVLRNVDNGSITPDPESRLGAYAATRGYPVGTVGNSVHNAIGTIYVTFANYGQERIGRVFNSPEARALYDQPVASLTHPLI